MGGHFSRVELARFFVKKKKKVFQGHTLNNAAIKMTVDIIISVSSDNNVLFVQHFKKYLKKLAANFVVALL